MPSPIWFIGVINLYALVCHNMYLEWCYWIMQLIFCYQYIIYIVLHTKVNCNLSLLQSSSSQSCQWLYFYGQTAHICRTLWFRHNEAVSISRVSRSVDGLYTVLCVRTRVIWMCLLHTKRILCLVQFTLLLKKPCSPSSVTSVWVNVTKRSSGMVQKDVPWI